MGAGSWGTALALLLAGNDYPVRLWDRDAGRIADLLASRENRRYLPGIALPDAVAPVASLTDAVKDAVCVVVAVPSNAVRALLEALPRPFPDTTDLVLAAKGMENDSGLLPAEIAEELKMSHSVALSGPNLAGEVAKGIPTAAVAACPDEARAKRVATYFNSPTFRVYSSTDRTGVEIGGDIKNVLAIAGGVSDGLGFGDNTKAALLTRGLAEMARFGAASGAKPGTFYGLAGVGDLMATAASRLSRNYRVGEALAKNEPLADILARLGQVAEGVTTARAVTARAARIGVELPVCDAVARLLFEGTSPEAEVSALMRRAPREE
ncbi:MAG: NAD(P)-dependent glycerol-3-phosphate dehydrogenase [Armatimonadetes bacterium]|nr:NAD(P)-dependent glycerol-3-phosphate dehydrogenase [Armatimonadota bacterium]